MENRIRLVSLLSNFGSGATLLTLLLNRHKEIVSNGEAFPYYRAELSGLVCSCGNILIDCDFYRRAASHMMSRSGDGWDPELFITAPHYSALPVLDGFLRSYRYLPSLRTACISVLPTYRKIQEKYLEAHIEFVRNCLKLTSKTVYLDGTKQFSRAELFATSEAMLQKVIYLVRDGRGYCNSLKKRKAQIKGYDIKMAAKGWVKHIDYFDAFCKRYASKPILLVRYEDLCRDPVATLKSIFDFLELPYEARLVKPDATTTHILGNTIKDTFQGDIKEDLSWKSTLSPGEIHLVTETMKAELRRFSYL